MNLSKSAGRFNQRNTAAPFLRGRSLWPCWWGNSLDATVYAALWMPFHRKVANCIIWASAHSVVPVWRGLMKALPPELFEKVFQALLARCQSLAPPNQKFRFKDGGKVYLLDATVIELPLSLFRRATYRASKGAMQLHVGLAADGYLPSFVDMTAGRVHEINKARELRLPRGSWVVFDRGYTDYQWYQELTKDGVHFVTRLKRGAAVQPGAKRRGCKSAGILEDREIRFRGVEGVFGTVRFLDEARGEEYEFVTNALDIPATTVAALYKERWRVELFFKWIKQHLKVKSFVGGSMNAVRTQLWIALCAYLLVAFIKFRSRLGQSILQILRLVQLNLFERRDLDELFCPEKQKIPLHNNQLSLFQI